MAETLTRMAADLRAANQPPDMARRPDVPWQDAPPGKTAAEMTTEQQQLLLLAAEGLAAHLRGQLQRLRAGSPQAHEIGGMLGTITVTANQLRRWIAAAEAAAQDQRTST